MKISELPALGEPISPYVAVADNGGSYKAPYSGSQSSAVDIRLTPTLTGRKIEISSGVFKPTKIVRVNWVTPYNGGFEYVQPHSLPNVDRFLSAESLMFNYAFSTTVAVTHTIGNNATQRVFYDRQNIVVYDAQRIDSRYYENAFSIFEYWEL